MFTDILGIDLSQKQSNILDNLHANSFSVLIMPQGMGKNYILAAYAIEKALKNPGTIVVITASSFKVATALGSRIESFLKQSDLLKWDSQHNMDSWKINIGKSKIIILPIDGSIIRGQRAKTIILLNASSIDSNTRDYIIMGSQVLSDDCNVVLSENEDAVSDKLEKEIEMWKNSGANFYLEREFKVNHDRKFTLYN
jgi:hypothetical protein